MEKKEFENLQGKISKLTTEKAHEMLKDLNNKPDWISDVKKIHQTFEFD